MNHLDAIFGEDKTRGSNTATKLPQPSVGSVSPLPHYRTGGFQRTNSNTTSRIMMMMILLTGVACISGSTYLSHNGLLTKWHMSGNIIFYVVIVGLLLMANNSSLA